MPSNLAALVPQWAEQVDIGHASRTFSRHNRTNPALNSCWRTYLCIATLPARYSNQTRRQRSLPVLQGPQQGVTLAKRRGQAIYTEHLAATCKYGLRVGRRMANVTSFHKQTVLLALRATKCSMKRRVADLDHFGIAVVQSL